MISITDGLQAIYNSNMREKTPLELEREVRQLTNNWNELEEFIQKELDNNADGIKSFSGYQCKIILDKMKEIKGEKNDKN